MQIENRKRLIWFAVFMIWIGMVASIVYHNQNSEQYLDLEASIPTTNTEVNVEKTSLPKGLADSSTPKIQLGKDSGEKAKKDLLIDYRLDRDKARSEQVSNYRELVNNPNSDSSIKKHAQELLLSLSKRIEEEMEVESLIRAAGFPDAVAFLHENSIDLIIQCAGLTSEEVAKIGDVVVRVTDLKFEDISIIENRVPNTK